MLSISFFLWSILFVIINIAPMPVKPRGSVKSLSFLNELDIKNRVVSVIHGTGLLSLAAYEYYFKPGSCGDATTPYERYCIYFAVGYFLYDFFCMAYYNLLDWTMTIHHWICIIGMTSTIVNEKGSNFVVCGMFIAESSNPPMHLRIMLKHLGMRYTKAYETFEIAFMVLYIYCRILLGLGLTWNTCLCHHNSLLTRFLAFALLA